MLQMRPRIVKERHKIFQHRPYRKALRNCWLPTRSCNKISTSPCMGKWSQARLCLILNNDREIWTHCAWQKPDTLWDRRLEYERWNWQWDSWAITMFAPNALLWTWALRIDAISPKHFWNKVFIVYMVFQHYTPIHTNSSWNSVIIRSALQEGKLRLRVEYERWVLRSFYFKIATVPVTASCYYISMQPSGSVVGRCVLMFLKSIAHVGF